MAQGWRGNRRRLLRGAALGTTGLTGLVLLACGGGDDSASSTTQSGAAGTQSSTGGGATTQEQPKSGGRLRVRQVGDPPNFSLLNASATTATFANHVYSSLLALRTGAGVQPNEFIPEPDLAQAMPEQPDPLSYVFKLRPGVKWQNVPPTNGRTLTAQEVKTAIDAYRAPSSPFAADWVLVDGVDAVDDLTVRIRMKEPFAPFINYVAGQYGLRIFPPELLEGDRMKTEAVGTGPWIRDRFEPGKQTIYRKNPDYFRPGLPYLDEVVFLIIPTQSSATAAFITDQVDVYAPDCTEAEDFSRTKPGAQVVSFPGRGGNICMNTTKAPFSDVRVRRAMSLAFNREAESKALYCGKAQPDQLFPIGANARALKIDQLGDGAQWYKYDPSRAKQLLQEAGYGSGFSTSIVYTPQYGEVYTSAVERSLGDFKAVGVTAQPGAIEYSQWISSYYRPPFNFDGMLVVPERAYADPEQYLWPFLHPTGVSNASHVNDPEITRLLETQRRTIETDKRWDLLSQIQRIAADKMYYVGRTTAVSISARPAWLRDYWTQIGYTSDELLGAWDSRR